MNAFKRTRRIVGRGLTSDLILLETSLDSSHIVQCTVLAANAVLASEGYFEAFEERIREISFAQCRAQESLEVNSTMQAHNLGHKLRTLWPASS